MRVWALVPVKGFIRAKSRLAQVLDGEARASFARAMLDHVLTTLRATHGIEGVLVLTDDEEVAAHVAERAHVLRDTEPAQPLARVVDAGLAHATQLGADAALVCMADLPALRSEELEHVLTLLASHDVVLAPDAQGKGTNGLALLLPSALRSAFGTGDSFALHQRAAQAHGLRLTIHRAHGLCFDVDGPDELAQLEA